MATLRLRNLRKTYGDVEVIKGVDLDIDDREFVVFVGPSGCGKSTLLRMIAGLEEITSGDLMIDGERVNDVPPAERGLAMVFQSYALYPHMTVARQHGLRAAACGRAQGRARRQGARGRARPAARAVARPQAASALSGGQRQRVAIGRAIVRAAQGVPVRRAALQPRRGAPGPDAHRARQAARRARRHHDLRHPRPGRGDDAGRQDRGAAGRHHRAGRHAARALPSSRQPVRRRLHRLAQDELPRRPRGRQRRRRRDGRARERRPGAGERRSRPGPERRSR